MTLPPSCVATSRCDNSPHELQEVRPLPANKAVSPPCRLRRLLAGVVSIGLAALLPTAVSAAQPIIVDHTSTDLSRVPDYWIDQARANLRVTYGHTSHGSQIVTGIEAFRGEEGSRYDYTYSGSGYAAGVFLNDYGIPGASDLGNPNYTSWATATRNLLNRAGGCDRNVVMWSWCGQADTSAENITTYLTLMNQLENDFPNVKFVYMTGHLVGSGEDGNLNQRNQQIRAYCRANNKILFDFADIESFDPDGETNFMQLYATDGCEYDTNGDGNPWGDGNWATEWIATNPTSELAQIAAVCGGCAHSEQLNCVLKGRVFWWLMARLAGWSGVTPTVGGCAVLPADNIWNTPIDTLPVDAHSADYISTIGASTGLHPDFGSGTWEGGPIGIPFTDVPSDQALVPMSFDYATQSDPGPYPIPPDAPIEGGSESSGDRHVLVVQQDVCKLYETWSSWPQADGSWEAGSGAVFELTSNVLRPAGWTSADAAGLPILPGLVRYDEVANGSINHAIRFTANLTQHAYVWPARHYASDSTDVTRPPMGQRFRLKSSFNISSFSPQVQVILKALKTYGLMLADNGSSWFITGAPDERWDNDVLSELAGVHGHDFEAVNVSSLMLALDSGQVRTLSCTAPTPPWATAPPSVADDATYTVSWAATTPDGTYELEEASSPDFASASSFAVTGTSRDFAHSGLATLYYRVRASRDCSGTPALSGWSATRSTTVSGNGDACDVEVSSQQYGSTALVQSCGAITAGPDVRVLGTGVVTFRAATSVVLGNGFSIAAGGAFTAGLDPSLGTL